MQVLQAFAVGLALAASTAASPLLASELVAPGEQSAKHFDFADPIDHNIIPRVEPGAQSCKAVDQDKTVHHTISIGISDGLWRCNAAYNAVSTDCDTSRKNDPCLSNWSCKSTSEGYYHIKFLAVSKDQGPAIGAKLLTAFPEIGSFDCPDRRKTKVAESSAASLPTRDLVERVAPGAQSCEAVNQNSIVHYTVSIGISDGLWRCDAAYNAVSTECQQGHGCVSGWYCKATSDGQGYYYIKFVDKKTGHGDAIDRQLSSVFPDVGSFNCPDKKRDIIVGGSLASTLALPFVYPETAAIINTSTANETAIMASNQATITTDPIGTDTAVAPQTTVCQSVTQFGAQDFVMSSRCQTYAVVTATTTV